MSNPPNLYDAQDSEHFKSLLSEDLQRVSLLNFWAPWAEPCQAMNEVVLELAKKYPNVLVLQIEAEEQQEIADSFDIASVPTFLILRGHTLLSRIEGADAPRLTKDVALHSHAPPQALSKTDKAVAPPVDFDESPEELNERLRKLMNQSKVVLFMKGSPTQPRCGFSRQTVGLLKEQNVEFSYFDILTDESVRSGLKALNDWPTFPQLHVNGEFVGGLDVVKEMISSGEFAEIMA